ncbi:MAG: peptidylprolyl isomerase [Flavobacteriales bacterium]|nr:peptidylprolyl isomerase [Flavobacteriales bacterium]MCB0795643.1 peptidylprolyl isomerase [Flavobacteriales bacterium]
MFPQPDPSKLLACLLILMLPLGLFAQETKEQTRPLVEIRTEVGIMVVALYNETPGHRDNFLKLVEEGFYDSLLFHRVIPQFMVQGGDPDSRSAGAGSMLGQGGPGYTLPAEIVPGLYHTKGALAAARQADDVNPEKRSSGSQFYIVHGKTFRSNELDMLAQRMARLGQPVEYSEEARQRYATAGGAPHLDGGYTVFGEVVEGLDVIDMIAMQACNASDRPLTDIHMWMRRRK